MESELDEGRTPMRSISGSDVAEGNALRQALARYIARPGMYGLSEDLEEMAKHVIHLLLTMLQRSWSLERTEAFWRQIASDLGFGERCAQDDEAYRIERWWRWGSKEDVARTQVMEGFNRIWAELHSRCRGFPYTKQWIDTLLGGSLRVGPPDVLEGVLWSLMMIVALPEELKTFDALYNKECFRIWRTRGPIRRLHDVGTSKDRRSRAPARAPNFTSHPRVVAGIQEALRRVDAMQAATGA